MPTLADEALPHVTTRYTAGGLVMSADLVVAVTPAQCHRAMRMAYSAALYTEAGLAMAGDTLQLMMYWPGLLSGEALAQKTQSFAQDAGAWRVALAQVDKQAQTEQAVRVTQELRIRQKIINC